MNRKEILDLALAYSDRTDSDVVSRLSGFVKLAEANINRRLKVMEQTHRIFTNVITGKEYYALPKDFLAMRVIQHNSGSPDAEGSVVTPIEYITPEMVAEFQNSEQMETGSYYTIINNQLQFHPAIDTGTIEMVFFRKVPAMETDTDSNWLSESAPDAYVSAVVCEIELFVKNYDAAGVWDTRVQTILDGIKSVDNDKRWSGPTMQMRVDNGY